MYKKILLGIIICITLVMFTGCNNNDKKEIKKENKVTDSVKFKKEYEELNNKDLGYGELREITIDEDNPFVYKSAEDIVKLIEDKETFVVYFGFNSCPWCRSVIETLIKVSKDNNIDTIYYVDVKDIRDVMVLDGDEAITDKEGSKGYYKLIEYFDNVLDDYTLNNEDGDIIKTGEKRIYAPNVIVVKNGKAKALVTGISEKQTKPNMELTDEMKEDTYNQFDELFEHIKEDSKVCTKNSKC